MRIKVKKKQQQKKKVKKRWKKRFEGVGNLVDWERYPPPD